MCNAFAYLCIFAPQEDLLAYFLTLSAWFLWNCTSFSAQSSGQLPLRVCAREPLYTSHPLKWPEWHHIKGHGLTGKPWSSCCHIQSASVSLTSLTAWQGKTFCNHSPPPVFFFAYLLFLFFSELIVVIPGIQILHSSVGSLTASFLLLSERLTQTQEGSQGNNKMFFPRLNICNLILIRLNKDKSGDTE